MTTAKMRHVRVAIQQDKMTRRIVEVPEWEAMVLQAAWGDDFDAGSATIVEIERRIPDARDEFERLAQRYGPRHADTPTVAGVFGNFGPGVRALEQAIHSAIVGDAATSVDADVDYDIDFNDLIDDADARVAA